MLAVKVGLPPNKALQQTPRASDQIWRGRILTSGIAAQRYGGSRALIVKQCLPAVWFQNTCESEFRFCEKVAHNS